jgi:hypothetical protein
MRELRIVIVFCSVLRNVLRMFDYGKVAKLESLSRTILKHFVVPLKDLLNEKSRE